MASIKDGITVKFSEYRPCLVCGTLKALFHRWSDVSEIVAPSPFEGKQAGGIIKGIVGIVELESGKVETTLPQNIQFLDNRIKEYGFLEPEILKKDSDKQ